MEAYTEFEHAELKVKIVHDDEPGYGPQENDNAGTIYSWARGFDGDRWIRQPDTISGRPYDLADATYEVHGEEAMRLLVDYFAENYDAALTIPLRFDDYGSRGARIWITDASDANCALCFTQEEIDYEWSGHVDPYPVTRSPTLSREAEVVEYGGARRYAEGRIEELDHWMQGNVWGIVVLDDAGETLESVWGFIGDPDAEYIRQEAYGMAEACAKEIEAERAEAHRWACRDIVTVAS